MEKASAGMWRKIDTRYNLVASECEKCKTLYFPPRIICRTCGRETRMKPRKLSGRGKVHSYTTIRVPSEAFKELAPYTVGVIELEEGPKVEGHVLERGKKIEIGTKVSTVFRKMYVDGEEGLIHYHFKFEVV
ncbi:MAG TPA: Zn-ribbon domain-containing OB-fold protein [Candidatus Saccharimonadales bacterium]|nr:Zn-ribbon domain-containing OB-fold protein [Candidatus Saccharimonadales bacterium]